MDFADDPGTTQEALMAATYEALRTHGYDELTIKRIGEAFPKSTSLIYHHYDGKDDLLVDFLAFMLEHFETNVPREDYQTAADQLEGLLAYVLPDDLEDERAAFTAAMIELFAQATHDDAYREHFTESTAFFRDRLAAIIERGIEEGDFREDVDPDAAAAMVLATLDGARLHRVAADDVEAAPIRAELERYLESLRVGESE